VSNTLKFTGSWEVVEPGTVKYGDSGLMIKLVDSHSHMFEVTWRGRRVSQSMTLAMAKLDAAAWIEDMEFMGFAGIEEKKTKPCIALGFQFNADDPNNDPRMIELRKKVKLANALREYEDTDKYTTRDSRWHGQRRYKVEIYYRLGRNNPYASYYRGRCGDFRIKKEHAQYAAVYVRDSIVWNSR